MDQVRVNVFSDAAKRLFDIALAALSLLFTLPFYPLIALLIFIDSGFPIFFTQVRMGRGGIPYNIIKFRTMRQDAEANGQPQWAEENDRRTTRVGIFLRKTHIDEIPQFINVLKGEMSIVGPRPEMEFIVKKYTDFERKRLEVKPGITGLWQIKANRKKLIHENLDFDLGYIENRSLALDLNIIIQTATGDRKDLPLCD